MIDVMVDLRTRREAQMRNDLYCAAVELFADRGVDGTTMTDIAAAAGVSRRTAYRYFATKEDIVFEQPRRWLQRLHDVLGSRAHDEALPQIMRRAVVAVAELIESERDLIVQAFAIVTVAPTLITRHAMSNAQWTREYADFILADLQQPSEVDVIRAGVIAGALVGGTDGALAVWVGQAEPDLVTLTHVVLDEVEPMWDSLGT